MRLGMSRPGMLKTIGAYAGRFSPFHWPNETIHPVFIRRAQELETLYDQWKAIVLAEAKAKGTMSAKDFADIVGAYPMKVLRLRYEAYGIPLGTHGWSMYGRAGTISIEDVEKMFEFSEHYLEDDPTPSEGDRRVRSSLNWSFLKWVRDTNPSYFDYSQMPNLDIGPKKGRSLRKRKVQSSQPVSSTV